MNLAKIEVKKLFGHYDHEITFDPGKPITIITAPNGYGKSVLLKIIDAIYTNDLSSLSRIKFEQVLLSLVDGSTVVIDSSDDNELTLNHNKDGGSQHHEWDHDRDLLVDSRSDVETSSLMKEISRFPWLDRLDDTTWFDEREGEVISLSEVVHRYSKMNPTFQKLIGAIPEWFRQITEATDVRLIQDQRLTQRVDRNGWSRHRYPSSDSINTIEKYARELSEAIIRLSSSYSNEAQKLDSSFPSRLLQEADGSENLTEEELREKLAEIEDKRKRLGNHDLIEITGVTVPRTTTTEEDRKVLALYVGDTQNKLAVYDEMLKRVELFTTLLNEKRLSFKKVVVNKKKGFEFQTDDGESLKLTKLSSGEQHQVVLLYELIFNTSESTLALIDEPEISLHVAWQKEFLDDLYRIIELQKLHAIVSTHSPQIINDNWDLVTRLDSGE